MNFIKATSLEASCSEDISENAWKKEGIELENGQAHAEIVFKLGGLCRPSSLDAEITLLICGSTKFYKVARKKIRGIEVGFLRRDHNFVLPK